MEYRLILVTAPAGYGKTALLIDFARRAEAAVCWYSIDEADRDPQSFFAHFIASVAVCFPLFGKQCEALLGNSSGVNVEQLVQTAVDDAFEHISDRCLIILDDYHLVAGIETIDRFVSSFARQMNENCHLILASRTLLNLPDLPLMVGRSEVGEVDATDLAFSADEIQTLLLRNYQVTMPAPEAEKLARETEGWITGLLLSTQGMWQGLADRVRLARGSGIHLFDYMAQQVLDQQPAPLREFLLRSAVMDEFDADLCRDVLGQDVDWRDLMKAVQRRNLFVQHVDAGRTWLRYHALFRDFLQTRLAQESPDEQNRILRRLVKVYSERGEWDRAHAVCVRLGDAELQADLIEQAGSPMIKSGRVMTLAQWIEDLPANGRASRPAIVSLMGAAATLRGESAKALALQDDAAASFRTAGDQLRLARTLVRRAVDLRILGNYPDALADADEALELTHERADARDIWAEALRVKGVCLVLMGSLNDALEWLARSLDAYKALGDEANTSMLHLEMGVAQMGAGRYKQVLTHQQHALSYFRKTGNLIRETNLLNNMGLLHLLTGEYNQAVLTLDRTVSCARQIAYTRAEAYALCTLGDVYAELEATDAALEVYHLADEIVQRIGERFLLLHLQLARAALHRSHGDLVKARTLIASARKLADRSISGFEKGKWRLEAGRLALAEGKARQAIRYLEEASRYFSDGGQTVEAMQTHFDLAVAQSNTRNKNKIPSHLKRAFDLAANLQSRHPLTVAARNAKAVLESVQDDPALGRPSSRLLREIAQFEQDLPALRRNLRQQVTAVPIGSPRLIFRALGKAHVLVEGRPVTGTEWEARVAREVTFCLLAHPDGLTKEVLEALIWPDQSPDALQNEFKSTMRRLRNVLGREAVPHDESIYRFNQALDYEYDVHAFEEKIKQARAASEPLARAAAYQAALDLYGGPFLPGIYSEWVLPERERLQHVFIEAALALAELYLDTRQYKVALETCQRILVQDPFIEEAYGLSMRAHAATGNLAAATRRYERCRQVLSKEAHVPLSPETVALYESLMRR